MQGPWQCSAGDGHSGLGQIVEERGASDRPHLAARRKDVDGDGDRLVVTDLAALKVNPKGESVAILELK